MSQNLEDYALLGDTHTAALVGLNCSIDWLCLPRFDSGACFTALLGGPEHGRWSLTPRSRVRSLERSYRGESLVIDTTVTCEEGVVRVVDCMPIRGDRPDLVRRVEGVRGRVAMRSELVPRFDYGHVVPWARRTGRRLDLLAGPDHLVVDADVEFDLADPECPVAEFTVAPGEAVDFYLSWGPDPTSRHDTVADTIRHTVDWWHEWASRCRYQGEYRDAVIRSLITLKALTYAPTGGIVAAPTTSLPEHLGGVRNWDYRFCWIRDATFTLLALLDAGYDQEARDWREWLLRAVAGRPDQIQIMYGIDGRRRLPELELDWLPGYANSRPVRVGNAAAAQFQLDVYGELMDALHQARAHGLPPEPDAWTLQRELMDFLESNWREPDNGIWEMRGPPRHFTHSKVMAWVAADRAVRAVTDFGLDGPASRWRRLRQEIHDEVCERVYDPARGTFTQYYGSRSLDAALLVMPNVGFLDAHDERARGTAEAVERELMRDGFVLRYLTTPETEHIDGPARRRGRVPAVHVLAGRQPDPARRGRRRTGDIRAPAVAAQRRRPAGRGVRPGHRAARRELPAGLLSHPARRHRAEPGQRTRPGPAPRRPPPRPRPAGALTMRALTVNPGKRDSLEVTDLPEPVPGPGDLLVDGLAVGVCGTDKDIAAGEYGTPVPGRDRLVVGHESLGRIREAPDGSGFHAGDLVVGVVRRPDPEPCGACAHGEFDMCRNGRFTERGIKELDGYASQRWVLDPRYAVPVDPGLGELGVLTEPTSVVAKVWEQIDRIGARSWFDPRCVLVIGAGPIGLLAALIGAQRGLEVHVLDQVTDGPKPNLVAGLGATYHHRGLVEVAGRIRPDVVVEATGVGRLALDAMRMNAAYGIVCLTGVSAAGRRIEVDAGALNRDLVLENDVVFGSVNANLRHYRLAVETLTQADSAWLAGLVTRRVPLTDARDAFTAHEHDVKVVLTLED